jgi:hypothetical protein
MQASTGTPLSGEPKRRKEITLPVASLASIQANPSGELSCDHSAGDSRYRVLRSRIRRCTPEW